jgi:hypothetical protein
MKILTLALTLTAMAIQPGGLLAQQENEELERRLEDLERLVDVLQMQVAEQAGAGIVPGGGNFVELRGLVLLNAFTNSAGVFMDDVPQWVLTPATSPTLPEEGGSASIRQTRLTFSVFSPQVLGGEFSGELDIDFFGGQHRSSGGRTFATLRMRRTRAQLDWTNVSLMVGQEAPPIAEVNPSSLAAMGFPGMVGAGNLWLWLPQVRLGVHTAGRVRLGLEGAVLAPTDGQPRDEPFYNEPDRAERTRRPFLQGRVTAGWGEPGAGGTLSFGGHIGWLANVGNSFSQTKALAASASLFLTRTIEFRGEAFTGQALRGLGGGGIYQNYGQGGAPLDTRGGWVQLNILPDPAWELGGGFGLDDPDDDGLGTVAGRSKNTSIEGHVIWRLTPVLVGLEVRRMETTFHSAGASDQVFNNTHINLALGFEF